MFYKVENEVLIPAPEKGIKIFEVYFEHQKEKISVITVPICSEKNN